MPLAVAEVHTSAPGKLFLSGEYAVLDGAPAVAMAVDRRAHVRAQQVVGDKHQVTASGYPAARAEFAVSECGEVVFDDLAGAAQYDLFTEVFELFSRQSLGSLGPCHWHLDTRAFYTGDRKLGIGSSAALSVALAGAIGELADIDSVADIAAAHRRAQSNLGSGVDLKVSRNGGLLIAHAASDVAQSLPWPIDLRLAVIDTGVSQSTSAALARLPVERNDPASKALRDSASHCAAAWSAPSDSLVDAIAVFRDALYEFDQTHGIGIFAGGHHQVAELSHGLPIVYKPSGAGGGDLGIAFSTDPNALLTFVQRCIDGGFKEIKLRLESLGLEVESS